MIWFILGPSGVGKSEFGKYLAVKHNWLHLEIDQFPNGDGIDIHGLRREWDQFYQRTDSRSIVAELKKRVVAEGKRDCALTFPSGVILSDEHMRSTSGQIEIIYLYGSAAHCINAFLNRERQSKRNLNVEHWITNNSASYILMSTPAFNPNRVHVFIHSGSRRTHDEVFAEISKTNDI